MTQSEVHKLFILLSEVRIEIRSWHLSMLVAFDIAKVFLLYFAKRFGHNRLDITRKEGRRKGKEGKQKFDSLP